MPTPRIALKLKTEESVGVEIVVDWSTKKSSSIRRLCHIALGIIVSVSLIIMLGVYTNSGGKVAVTKVSFESFTDTYVSMSNLIYISTSHTTKCLLIRLKVDLFYMIANTDVYGDTIKNLLLNYKEIEIKQ